MRHGWSGEKELNNDDSVARENSANRKRRTWKRSRLLGKTDLAMEKPTE